MKVKHNNSVCPYCRKTFTKQDLKNNLTNHDHVVSLGMINNSSRDTLEQLRVHRTCHARKNLVEKYGAPVLGFPGPSVPRPSLRYQEMYQRTVKQIRSLDKGRQWAILGRNLREDATWRTNRTANPIRNVRWPKKLAKNCNKLIKDYHIKGLFYLANSRPIPVNVSRKIICMGSLADFNIHDNWNYFENHNIKVNVGQMAYGDILVKWQAVDIDPDTSLWNILYNYDTVAIVMLQSPRFKQFQKNLPKIKN